MSYSIFNKKLFKKSDESLSSSSSSILYPFKFKFRRKSSIKVKGLRYPTFWFEKKRKKRFLKYKRKKKSKIFWNFIYATQQTKYKKNISVKLFYKFFIQRKRFFCQFFGQCRSKDYFLLQKKAQKLHNFCTLEKKRFSVFIQKLPYILVFANILNWVPVSMNLVKYGGVYCNGKNERSTNYIVQFGDVVQISNFYLHMIKSTFKPWLFRQKYKKKYLEVNYKVLSFSILCIQGLTANKVQFTKNHYMRAAYFRYIK